ncbi:MAG TPA: glycosyltransferase family 2 protein [Saprospiraceae bacterium]|nr:glycosyltransferase family 2 protein [Saprospiraceae bacterium]HRG65174.1 glycosyltransferase family 2 protein [Saprospiraceae bacterium]
MVKICGFTFIRNAVKYDFPVVEAIQSILPLCDQVFVAVGQSEDATRELIANISPKIVIIDTIWEDQLRSGGTVLAQETNKAFNAIPLSYDWCIYIQGDEVIHEKYLPIIKDHINLNHPQKNVDGLVLHYLHFYGNFQYIADASRWYRREVRIIRNDKSIFSYRDAQGFRKKEDEKLRVKIIPAWVYHYGYVKHPATMKAKVNNSNRYWHSDDWLNKNAISEELFDYNNIDSLTLFKDSHPAVMLDRIKAKDWDFQFDIQTKKRNLKEKIKYTIEKWTGWRIGEYKNYTVIR